MMTTALNIIFTLWQGYHMYALTCPLKHVSLVTITGTTILVPYQSQVKYLHLIWRLVACRIHFGVPDPGIILYMHTANERRLYNMSSLIGEGHTQNDSSWSSKVLKRLDHMTGYQESNPSNDHQGNMPHSTSKSFSTFRLETFHLIFPLVTSRVSCQKGPICHAQAWQVGPFWQDTLGLYPTGFVWILQEILCDLGALNLSLKITATTNV